MYEFRDPTVESTRILMEEGFSDPREFTAAQKWTPEQKGKWEDGFRAHAKFLVSRGQQKRQEAATRQGELEARAATLSEQLPGVRDVRGGLRLAMADVASAAARPFDDDLADFINRAAGEEEQALSLAGAGDDSPILKTLQTGLRGATRSLGSAAVLAPLGGAGMIVGFAGSRGNQAITEGRDAGLKGKELAKFVGRSALIEGGVAGAFQVVGLGGFEKILGGGLKAGARASVGSILGQTLAEVTEENITEVMDAYNQAYSGVTGEVTSEQLKSLFISTTTQTLMGMGAAHTFQNRKAITEGLMDRMGWSESKVASFLRRADRRKGSLEESVGAEMEVEAAVSPEAIAAAVAANPEAFRNYDGSRKGQRATEGMPQQDRAGREMTAAKIEAALAEVEAAASPIHGPDISPEGGFGTSLARLQAANERVGTPKGESEQLASFDKTLEKYNEATARIGRPKSEAEQLASFDKTFSKYEEVTERIGAPKSEASQLAGFDKTFSKYEEATKRIEAPRAEADVLSGFDKALSSMKAATAKKVPPKSEAEVLAGFDKSLGKYEAAIERITKPVLSNGSKPEPKRATEEDPPKVTPGSEATDKADAEAAAKAQASGKSPRRIVAAPPKKSNGSKPEPKQEAPPPKKGKVPEPPAGEPDRVTSALKAMNENERAIRGLDGIDSPERRSWQENMDEARAAGADSHESEAAGDLATSVAANPYAMSDRQTATLVTYAAALKEKHEALTEQIEASRNDSLIAEKSVEVSLIEHKFDVVTEALIRSGSEKGRALVSQKLTIDSDFRLIAVKARAKASKGATLTEKEAKDLTDTTGALKKAVKRAEKAEAKVREQVAEKAVTAKGPKPKASLAEQVAKVQELLTKGCAL